MRRPIALYFVAAWCGVVSYTELWVAQFLLLRWFLASEQPINQMPTLIPHLLPLTVSAWLVLELLQLKEIGLRLCKGALVIAIVLAGLIPLFHPNYADANAMLIGTLAPILAGVSSVFSICYLTGPYFREFARQFVEEQRKRR
jgi:hypothetical protein